MIQQHGASLRVPYRSPRHWVEVFRAFYGPVHKASSAGSMPTEAALEDDLMALRKGGPRGTAGLVVPAEYRETVITR